MITDIVSFPAIHTYLLASASFVTNFPLARPRLEFLKES